MIQYILKCIKILSYVHSISQSMVYLDGQRQLGFSGFFKIFAPGDPWNAVNWVHD